jgi:hypothetical protein
MGGDLTKKLKIGSNAGWWGILRRSNVSKQTHPGDRSRQNILIIFNIKTKSHKKASGHRKF